MNIKDVLDPTRRIETARSARWISHFARWRAGDSLHEGPRILRTGRTWPTSPTRRSLRRMATLEDVSRSWSARSATPPPRRVAPRWFYRVESGSRSRRIVLVRRGAAPGASPGPRSARSHRRRNGPQQGPRHTGEDTRSAAPRWTVPPATHGPAGRVPCFLLVLVLSPTLALALLSCGFHRLADGYLARRLDQTLPARQAPRPGRTLTPRRGLGLALRDIIPWGWRDLRCATCAVGLVPCEHPRLQRVPAFLARPHLNLLYASH